MVVRPAEQRDVDGIRAIDAKVYPTPWSEQMTIDQTTGAGRLHYVIEENHRLVAHGGIAVLGDDAHVMTIAVDPKHQRRGLGDFLLRQLFAAADANGCRGVTLEVRASNSAAIAMYEKHGMASEGIRPRYYADNGEDAIIMWSNSGGTETDA